MLLRTRRTSSGFIEPCLPSPANHPPSGPGWIHEITPDGFRLMAGRGAADVRLRSRNRDEWSPRYSLIVEPVAALRVRSCLIDGEAVACDDNGVAVFAKLRQLRNELGRVKTLGREQWTLRPRQLRGFPGWKTP